jgi:hypothetical protein
MEIAASAYNGISYTPESGFIRFIASENFGATNRGTELIFGTTPVGDASTSERVRIDDSGLLELIQNNSHSLSGVLQLQDKAAGLSPGGSNHSARVYFRNANLVVSYDDAGTIRYKYLDLTGTGVTWTHSIIAP